MFDAIAERSASLVCPEPRYPASMDEAASGACVVLLLTEWPQFAALQPADLAGIVSRKNIIDARNVLRPELWQAAGWNYRALGIGAPAKSPL